ncbi:hypothetical protein CONCODRAFT_10147 [Conidiobolus coronatus NRRL 28638]|uniref:Uncharacterized protein n=1 Tax=Conidiobolus coronatus (strain ATCC 28846 / CBS 209.66 / NRRL 28638) TaxID=796925 RepID=A0A137NXY6_CONC2|nr:hypothetical protein CONCODRAFT_10147 [Conidiobolus coronatus NRRL 28638]|eukprot:KXN67733.1 hypothetical protein CONCODRAFT_10147 [Conidiobolus coronatus NRRL 28638]
MEELVQTKVVYPHQLLNIISLVNEGDIWRNGLISKKSAKTWFKSPLSADHADLLEFDELNLGSNIENSRSTYAKNMMLSILDKSTQVPISAQEIPRDSPPPETPKPDTDKPYKFKIFHPKMESLKLKDFVSRLSYRWGTRLMEDPGIVAVDQRPIRNIAYLSQPLPPVSPIHSQKPVFAQTQPIISSAHQPAYSQSQLSLPSSQQPAYTQSQLSLPSSQQPASSQAPPYSIFSQPPTALGGFGSSTQPTASNLPFTTMSQPAPRAKPVQKKRTRGF